jgi:hypothetical protein
MKLELCVLIGAGLYVLCYFAATIGLFGVGIWAIIKLVSHFCGG